jgi:riboflavin synthase
MFTGLVDDVGVIAGVTRTAAGRELEVSCRYDDLVVGESVSCNGACLTVTECGPRRFRVAAVVTTLDRTTIGSWEPGHRVNLERAMRADGRFGGHIVLGHVDGVGTVRSTAERGDAHLIDIEVPGEVAALLIPHGSITVDGVSLTVNHLPEPAVLQVSIIAHTLRATTLGGLRLGDRVHLESDVIGKYVHRLLGGSRPPGGPAPISPAFD